jgi:phosphoribosylformimino-5-aminoimidazole carboxamide ribotide isomerase
MAEMKGAVSVPVIASGGVTTAKDVADLARLGMDGCIIGRALYEGTISLTEALSASQEQ